MESKFFTPRRIAERTTLICGTAGKMIANIGCRKDRILKAPFYRALPPVQG
jgi:hypothetical protein